MTTRANITARPHRTGDRAPNGPNAPNESTETPHRRPRPNGGCRRRLDRPSARDGGSDFRERQRAIRRAAAQRAG
ncbi:hypothetical protein BOC51_14265 [Burkholderia pseudomallei]|nr:hypothetical protein BOC43_25865 [Burkholderia pseudomallei]ARL51002.1 hypothetical protein BOC51_14265 [Burkholderia pseudomallei]